MAQAIRGNGFVIKKAESLFWNSSCFLREVGLQDTDTNGICRLTADALHSLTDLISDFMTLATISYSIRPATSRFPMGYGKIESLGALAVSGILLSGGFMIGMQAVLALSQQFFPEIAEFLSHSGMFEHGHSHGHSHGPVDVGPNINAAWLAAASIGLKEWLYRATMKVAKEKRSSVLASNAYHRKYRSHHTYDRSV